MAKFSITFVAHKWHFFTFLSTINFYCEYFNLFMKQLGFNPAQIGFTTLMGLPNLLAPLYLLLGEKFRARKTVLIVVAVAFSVCCVLPVLSLIVPALQPKCYSKTLIDSFEVTQQAPQAPAPLKYVNNANIFKRSVVSSKDIIHLYPFNMTTLFLRENFIRPSNRTIQPNDPTKQPSQSKNKYSLHHLRTNISTLTITLHHILSIQLTFPRYIIPNPG